MSDPSPFQKKMKSQIPLHTVRRRLLEITFALLPFTLTLITTHLNAGGRNIDAVGPHTVAVDLEEYTTIVHVSATTGSDQSGDGSRGSPYGSIVNALQGIEDPGEDNRTVVLVAEGIYQKGTIELRPHVDLFGGYSAGTWERNILENESILDGLHSRRVLVGASHARIDGFVIRSGRTFGYGGALLCDNTSPVVTNNRFEQNHTIQPKNFRNDLIHQQGNYGGAIACLYNSVPRINNNLFVGNWTEIGEGGAIAIFGWIRMDGDPIASIENNVFIGNISGLKDHGRTRSSSGGAISCSHEASPIIRNNVIAHNRAMGRSDAGGVYCEYFSSPTIEHNWIVGNEGDDDGGGIYTMRLGEPAIHRNLIAGNWTTGGGVGGVRVSKEGRARVTENVIVQNQSGGGVYLVDGWTVVQGNTIADNIGGSGIRYIQNFNYFQPTRIENNAIFGNEGEAISFLEQAGAAPVVENNTFEENPIVSHADLDWNTTDVRFDDRRHQSTIKLENAELEENALAGRAVHLGLRWSIVVGNRADTVVLWGDFSAPDGPAPQPSGSILSLLPDYQIPE